MQYLAVNKQAVFTGHKDCIYAMCGHQAHGVFFTSGSDGLVVRWDLAEPDKGTLVAQVRNTVYALQYVEEANQLIVGQNYDGLHIIDLNHNREINSVKLVNAPIFDVKYYQERIFVSTGDGQLIVLNYKDLAVIKRVKLSAASARCLAINPVERQIAIGSSDNLIRIMDLETFEPCYNLEGHENSVFSLAYSPDFKFLLSGSRDAHMKIWESENDYQLHQSIVAHMFTINHIAFRSDGLFFATCSKDKSVKVWRTADFKLLKVIDKSRHAGHGTSVNKLLWAGKTELVSCSDDRSISHWHLIYAEELSA